MNSIQAVYPRDALGSPESRNEGEIMKGSHQTILAWATAVSKLISDVFSQACSSRDDQLKMNLAGLSKACACTQYSVCNTYLLHRLASGCPRMENECQPLCSSLADGCSDTGAA